MFASIQWTVSSDADCDMLMITVFWVLMLCSVASISDKYVRNNSVPLKMEAAGICKEKLFIAKTEGRLFIRNVAQTTEHHIPEEINYHSNPCLKPQIACWQINVFVGLPI
jgi:hypothetical protein